MNIFRLMGCALLHLIPRVFIEKWLIRRLSPQGYSFFPKFSGRVALLELAKVLRQNSKESIALFPEYVCNIVPRSLTDAGWKIESYKVDEKLEANWTYLIDRMNKGDIGLLVGVSVFGSSGLLDDIKNKENIEKLRLFGVKVIIDLAQDIRLIKKLPEYGNDIISSLVSFNDKSFQGIMGGGIVTNFNFKNSYKKIDTKSLYILYKSYFFKNIQNFLKNRYKNNEIKGKLKFEYSNCNKFPFRLSDNYKTTKLQLICAFQGILMIKKYERKKLYFLLKNNHLETRFASSAAYLIIINNYKQEKNRKKKFSYAVEQQPEFSINPNEIILHNKGFDDFY